MICLDGYSFDIRANNLIDVIPKMGPIFKIEFKLFIERIEANSRIDVLSYTSLYLPNHSLELYIIGPKKRNSKYGKIYCRVGGKLLKQHDQDIMREHIRFRENVSMVIEQKLHYDQKVSIYNLYIQGVS